VVSVDVAVPVNAAMAIRAGQGPFFIEARTYRFRAHSMFDAELYRLKAEVEDWKKHGPLITLTTDFGLSDPFVGIMKGVIATRAPQVSVVDLSHGPPRVCSSCRPPIAAAFAPK